MNEAIRLLNVIINNQQVTGKRFRELEDKIDANSRSLNQIIDNQDRLNLNLGKMMQAVLDLKPKKD